MSKVVIFGTGSFAEVVDFYLRVDSEHEAVAFTVHEANIGDTTELAGKPVVPFEQVAERYPPSEHQMFVAVGYRKVNRLRADLCRQAKDLGYDLITYVSSKATHWGDTKIGENCFVFEDNTIQPFVEIGDDVILWSGNHIGHHARIGDHCFVSSHVVISGHTRIGPYSFLGVNSTFRDDISVGESNVIGAGSIIMKSTEDHELYVPSRTKPDGRRSDEVGL